MKKTNRNGKIEFLRFFFSVGVLLFHLGKYIIGEPSFERLELGLFPHGAMGVEFFFIVSGWLMANSVFKKLKLTDNTPKSEQDAHDGKDFLAFIIGKTKIFFIEHSVAFIITLVSYILIKEISDWDIFFTLMESIPSFFLIQMSGIDLISPNHIEWYLSCMLLSMAIIYPFLKKHYYKFTRFFAPLFAILILGYLIKTTGSLTGVSVWLGIGYKSLFRAICCIALGTTAFEISRYLSQCRFSVFQKLLFNSVELCLFSLIAFYLVFTAEKKYEIIVLIFIFVLVALSFGNISLGVKLFNNKLFYHLGKISLPIYLTQLAAINFTKLYFSYCSIKQQLITAFCLTFLLAYFVYFVSGIYKKITVSKKKV